MLALGLLTASCRAHETPEDAVIANRIVATPALFFERFAVRRGEIIRLTLLSDHPVLEVIPPGDYFLCFGLTEVPSGPRDWYVTSTGDAGFFALGNITSAVVEIIAVSDVTLSVAASFLSPAAPGCTAISAGNLFVYQPSAAARTCFFLTDSASQVTARGAIANSSLEILSAHQSLLFGQLAPLPAAGLSSTSFLIVRVTSTGPDADLAVEFAGGHLGRFETVTVGIGRGIVGIEGIRNFERLVGEPDYPFGEQRDYMGIVVPLLIVVVVVVIVLMFCAARRTRRLSMIESSELYDAQNPGQSELSSSRSAPSPIEEEDEEAAPVEENPYADNAEVGM
jgi:hypothetical protein